MPSTRTRRREPPSIGLLLSRANLCIVKGEASFREAAEYIATAAERGATQRKIAAGVGKSVAWVNALLAWHRGGCQDTPFGSSAVQASRERAAVQDLNKTTPEATPETFEQVDVPKAVIAVPVHIPTREEIAAFKVTHLPLVIARPVYVKEKESDKTPAPADVPLASAPATSSNVYDWTLSPLLNASKMVDDIGSPDYALALSDALQRYAMQEKAKAPATSHVTGSVGAKPLKSRKCDGVTP